MEPTHINHVQESKQHHELIKTKPKYQKFKHKREGLHVIGYIIASSQEMGDCVSILPLFFTQVWFILYAIMCKSLGPLKLCKCRKHVSRVQTIQDG